MEETAKKRFLTVICSVCGEKVPKKGTTFVETDGKRIFTCPDCGGDRKPIKHKAEVSVQIVSKVHPIRKSCFFCNDDIFHLNMDGSFQCAGCGSIFFKGQGK